MWGLPVNSKIKLWRVTSRVLALKVSAILRASTLFNPDATTLIRASSLSINGPSIVRSLTSLTGIILDNWDLICSIVREVPFVTIDILDKCLFLSISVTVKLSILYPLPENKPTTLASAPGWLSTITDKVLELS